MKVSNQKYNDSLELMFQELNRHHEGIFDIYTSHNGRDTFISFMNLEGFDVPSILSFVGQSSWVEMKKYTKIFNKHSSEQMNKTKIFSGSI